MNQIHFCQSKSCYGSLVVENLLVEKLWRTKVTTTSSAVVVCTVVVCTAQEVGCFGWTEVIFRAMDDELIQNIANAASSSGAVMKLPMDTKVLISPATI